jgi:hypothetical protein
MQSQSKSELVQILSSAHTWPGDAPSDSIDLYKIYKLLAIDKL